MGVETPNIHATLIYRSERELDLLDRLALTGRRYEKRHSVISGSTHLTLNEVVRMFNGKTILEMETHTPQRPVQRSKHDTSRRVSLIDGIAEIDGGRGEWYEVLQTAPSGDFSRVKVISQPSAAELSLLIGRRVPEHSAAEDPLLESLRNHTASS